MPKKNKNSNKTEDLISDIIDLSHKRLKLGDNKYTCVSIYDCVGSWQVWLNLGKAGYMPFESVLINGKDYAEGESINDAMSKLIKLLGDKKSIISIVRYL